MWCNYYWCTQYLECPITQTLVTYVRGKSFSSPPSPHVLPFVILCQGFPPEERRNHRRVRHLFVTTAKRAKRHPLSQEENFLFLVKIIIIIISSPDADVSNPHYAIVKVILWVAIMYLYLETDIFNPPSSLVSFSFCFCFVCPNDVIILAHADAPGNWLEGEEGGEPRQSYMHAYISTAFFCNSSAR